MALGRPSRAGALARTMSKPVVTACSSQSVSDVVRLMERHRIGAIPITDDAGILLGIITESDLLRILARNLEHPDPRWIWAARAGEHLSANLVTIESNRSYAEAVQMMAKNRIRRLPVTDPDSDELVGMITERDILERLSSFTRSHV